MEQLPTRSRTRLLGISNVTLGQLEELYATLPSNPQWCKIAVSPPPGGTDRLRSFCASTGIVYQGFSLLTPTSRCCGTSESVTSRRDSARPFTSDSSLRRAVGMVALTGTTAPEHMEEASSIFDFDLKDEESSVYRARRRYPAGDGTLVSQGYFFLEAFIVAANIANRRQVALHSRSSRTKARSRDWSGRCLGRRACGARGTSQRASCLA